MILDVIDTILGGLSVIFIIFGWIIPYKQSQKQQSEQRKYEKSVKMELYQKEKIDEQISKLYVPLYTLSLENKMQIDILLKKLNRKYVFVQGQTINDLNEIDRTIWIDFLKNHFVPNLNCMRNILNSNLHLIFEPELPLCYQKFMKYTLKLNDDLELYLVQPNSDCSTLFVEDNYPSDFDTYINRTLDKLLQLQRDNLIRSGNEQTFVFDKNIEDIDFEGTVVIRSNI